MAEYFKWVLIASLLLLLLEIAKGRHKNIYCKSDFIILAGSILLGRGVMAALATGVVAAVYSFLLPGSLQGALAGLNYWLALLLVILSDEFFFYWVHRNAHEGWGHKPYLNWLWKMHRTHHSADHLNVTVIYRLNLFWFFVIPTAWVMGLMLYLGLSEAALTAILIKQFWNLITHSNFRWDDTLRNHPKIGPVFRGLEHVFVSPGLHHTHHGYGKDGKHYRNFGVVLSVYDWLFGTLHIPSGRPANYGLPGENTHWLEELGYPLVRSKVKPVANAALD